MAEKELRLAILYPRRDYTKNCGCPLWFVIQTRVLETKLKKRVFKYEFNARVDKQNIFFLFIFHESEINARKVLYFMN